MLRARLLTLALATGCTPAPKAVPPSPDQAIARVTANLRPAVAVVGAPPVTRTLADRMARYKVPGVSIAVADSGKLVWARGFGLKAAGTADSVTPTTMFQAASISKPVAATAMLRLVEEGTLNLDKNVNDYLKDWKVPDNKFTKQHKVTLRRLVSHNAGLTVHGFPGYKAGDPLPSVLQILDGKKPANTGPVRVDTVPGSRWRYSGGGTTLMQYVVMTVTAEPFAATMKRLVLDPVGMTNSTYEQPLPAGLEAQASSAHLTDGTVTPGRWHTYPEQAAAGLWTTPTDLLKWAMSITESYDGGERLGVLSRDMAKQMLTVAATPSGLGPMLNGRGKGFRFSHGGSNQGFRCELVYFPSLGKGAAVMTNSDGGGTIASEVLNAIAAEYGWLDYGPKEVTPVPVDSAGLAALAGTYGIAVPFPATLQVTVEGGKLVAEAAGILPKTELVMTAPTKAMMVDLGEEISFGAGKTGGIESAEVGGLVFKRKAATP